MASRNANLLRLNSAAIDHHMGGGGIMQECHTAIGLFCGATGPPVGTKLHGNAVAPHTWWFQFKVP